MRNLIFLLPILCFCLFGYAGANDFCEDIVAYSTRISVDDYVLNAGRSYDLRKSLDIELLEEVMDIVSTNHMDRGHFDKQKMSHGMVNGLVESLDRHSHFLNTEEAERQAESLSGTMNGGIGIIFKFKKRYVMVDKVMKNSPAEKAGIKPKDKIISVNGIRLRNTDDASVISKFRGDIGTSADLTILRRGVRDPINITVVRAIVDIQSVYYEVVKKSGKKFAILHISQFSENTYHQFCVETEKMIQEKPDYIIFDLRNNPGGFVNSVCAVMSDIVGRGKILLQSDDGKGEINRVFSFSFRTKDGIFSKDKTSVKGMVCLVNEGTASAAEIMSSGLRDILGIKIIGETTYGKGTGWTPVTLKSGKGVCNVTCFKWLTPNGNSIEEVGVDPDIEVFMDEEDVFLKKDPQLEAAFKELLSH